MSEICFLTLKEVAAMLRLSQRTVYKLLAQGRLPGAKVGGQWRFDQDQVQAWLGRGGDRQQDHETAAE